MANEQMRDFWDGQGAEWVRHHEIFDRMLAPFGAAVVEALAPRPGAKPVNPKKGARPANKPRS